MAKSGKKIVARNRKAQHDYEILDDWEAGLVLTGTEVKSLRQGTASIAEAYVRPRGEELYLVEAHIPPYVAGNIMNHDETRPRKLLLHRREMDGIIKELQRGNVTCIPLQLYFRDGFAKVKIGLAQRRKKWDKRRKKEKEQYKRDALRDMRRRKR